MLQPQANSVENDCVHVVERGSVESLAGIFGAQTKVKTPPLKANILPPIAFNFMKIKCKQRLI